RAGQPGADRKRGSGASDGLPAGVSSWRLSAAEVGCRPISICDGAARRADRQGTGASAARLVGFVAGAPGGLGLTPIQHNARPGNIMKVINVVGARPNFMKMAPIVAAMNARAQDFDHLLVHTGQHYDQKMSKAFFDELGMPKPDMD